MTNENKLLETISELRKERDNLALMLGNTLKGEATTLPYCEAWAAKHSIERECGFSGYDLGFYCHTESLQSFLDAEQDNTSADDIIFEFDNEKIGLDLIDAEMQYDYANFG